MIRKKMIPESARMRIISLQSGSNGNCIYIESNDTRLLIDAGISGSQAQNRLTKHDIDINTVNALLITHDHFDHASCMGIYHRKYGIPIWATEKTYQTASSKRSIGKVSQVNHFVSGECFKIKNLTVETIRTPHDAADGVVYIIDNGHARFGVMTDLGHVFNDLQESISSLDAVLIESNYDPTELHFCSYPDDIKARIKGNSGHISNLEAAKLVDSAKSRLQWACLGHISEQSNHPDLVRQTYDSVLRNTLPFYIASRYNVSEVMMVQ